MTVIYSNILELYRDKDEARNHRNTSIGAPVRSKYRNDSPEMIEALAKLDAQFAKQSNTAARTRAVVASPIKRGR